MNPAELLITDALGWTFDQLGHLWDIVVLDTAAFGSVADTLLLARHASGCVIVARSGRTRRASLRGTRAAFDGFGVPVLGVVLNDERPGPLARLRPDDYFRFGYWTDHLSGSFDNGLDARQNGGAPARAPAAPEMSGATAEPEVRSSSRTGAARRR